MSQRRLDTYNLSQWHFLKLHAAGPIGCVCCLILYFQQVSVLKLSGGPLNVCSDNSEGLPLIFHLPPPVRCPFQSLIYGPHKCWRDAEISEEVINRTSPKKRGTTKQTEEVTGTCSKSASMREKEGEIFGLLFKFYCREKTHCYSVYCTHCLSGCLVSFLPVTWPLNYW